MRTDNMACIKR